MGYLGSKAASGAFQAIIAAMPPHDVYIEAYLGSGVVMRHKPPAARSIGLDLDPAAIEAFTVAGGCVDVELLRGVDALAFLRDFDWARADRALVYLDPPYLLSTRTSTKRYRCDYTEADHVALLDLVVQLPAAVILSGYPSALYDVALPTWRSFTFQAMTRGGPRTEKLWMNFPAGEVQWSRFAGRNFTDRQRIKRKAARWAANWARLPAGERAAVLAAVLEAGAGLAVPSTIDAVDVARSRTVAAGCARSPIAGAD